MQIKVGLKISNGVMASTASCMNWHCSGQISMQSRGATNKQCSLGMIRFVLNRASPKVHSSEGTTRLAAGCTHALA